MVKFLTYKEKRYPVRVSYFALKMLRLESEDEAKKSEKNTSDAVNPLPAVMALVNNFAAYEGLLWYGLLSGHKAMGEKGELSLKREDMEDMLDEVLVDFVDMLPDFFGVIKEETSGESEKKSKEMVRSK